SWNPCAVQTVGFFTCPTMKYSAIRLSKGSWISMKGTIYRGHVEGITISVKYMRKKATVKDVKAWDSAAALADTEESERMW
ncbi:hypothetical protein, partial [Faecalibaculum rodentium]|uniref:hypothetical protein n=1 Tax=Faecalibaculum rodentium TaxID=1702221 RepID=UPI0026F3FEC4